MGVLASYQQEDGQAGCIWHEMVNDEGQLVVTNGEQAVPVVGTLTATTTPADFRRFGRITAAYWARQQANSGGGK